MTFEAVLAPIVDECGGGVAIALLGNDGVPIDSRRATTTALPLEDVSAVGVELGRVFDEARKAADSLQAGGVFEMVVSLARYTAILRRVDDDSYLALVLAPDGNLGKARYLIRRSLPDLRELLG